MTDFARDLFAASPWGWTIGAIVVAMLTGLFGGALYMDAKNAERAKEADGGDDRWFGGGAL